MRYHFQSGVIHTYLQKYYKQIAIIVAGLFVASMASMTFGASAVLDPLYGGCDIVDDAAGTWTLQRDCDSTQQIDIPAGIIFDGDGFTISPIFAKPSPTANDNNSVLGIGADGVTVKNLVINGSSGTDLHGINVYRAESVIIENVSIADANRSAIVVNGSTVSVSNVATSGSGWHGINPGQGGGVIQPAILNIDGPMQQSDAKPIQIDAISQDVTVNDNYTQYVFSEFPYTTIYGNFIARVYWHSPEIPTNLHRVLASNTAETLSCGDVTTRQTLYPTWNDNAESSPIFSHYEYNSFNNGVSGIVKRVFNTNQFVHSWTPPADGTFGYQVRSVDVLGNYSEWSPVCDIIYDSVAPEQVLGMTVFKGTDTSGMNLGCSGYTNEQWITVDWNDSSDVNFAYYRYQVKTLWSTTLIPSQRTGQISNLDGDYKYRVQAVDMAGNVGEYSEWCNVTLDRAAPIVDITLPADSAVLSGSVGLEGSVTDNLELRHYNMSLYSSTTDLSDGGTHSSDRLNDANWCTTPMSGTVVTGADVVGTLCSGWDTTNYPDGDYQIRLAARDASGLRDTTDPYTGGTTSVHVINITISNEVAEEEEGQTGVLGASTTNTDGGAGGSVLGASTGVLGDSDTLADTGRSYISNFAVFLFLLSTSAMLWRVAKD